MSYKDSPAFGHKSSGLFSDGFPAHLTHPTQAVFQAPVHQRQDSGYYHQYAPQTHNRANDHTDALAPQIH
ncbi:hypothetical protein E4T43_02574 [Aureobasidium subglaciale]|nr:hypothetical protein E4T43_02574 [Aureobasidium subglaciale]